MNNTLNRLTSSLGVYLAMFVVVNIAMMTGSPMLSIIGGWVGIHVGMTLFANINWWKLKY